MRTVLKARRTLEVEDLGAPEGELPQRPWSEAVRRALVLPIQAAASEHLAGLLVVGVSPRRPLDPPYRDFLDLVTAHLGSVLTDARAYESERKRAEALAELDRAKTAFFTNISHEFRTPLTLMLGPLEEELRANPQAQARLEVVHRNSLRLLKRVNTLLEFSRIEAGRGHATFQATDPDGEAAFAAALACRPDLVLTDVMMPRLDGFGLLNQLRSEPRTRTLPVIFLSARAGEEARVDGVAQGADDYLVKPFTARELQARVSTHLALARVRGELEAELRRGREELEAKVAERTHELAQANALLAQRNAELDAFNYSVSHDLRGPVRIISSFARLLVQTHELNHNPESRYLLDGIITAGDRMARLIEDHLTVGADEEMLRILVDNLLRNAWTFTSRKEAAWIKVGCRPEGGRATFFVRDNGAGFNMAHVGRLFAPFQRLHTDQEFPGTGIGLAMSRRIVERLGGTIWARGKVDRGAAIYFQVPDMAREGEA